MIDDYFYHGRCVLELFRNGSIEMHPKTPIPKDVALFAISALKVWVEMSDSERALKEKDSYFHMLNERLDVYSRSMRDSLRGFVYVYKLERSASYKIGFSKNPDVRCKKLKTLFGAGSIVYRFPSSLSGEEVLHNVFSFKSVGREFFSLTSDDLEFIQLVKGRL